MNAGSDLRDLRELIRATPAYPATLHEWCSIPGRGAADLVGRHLPRRDKRRHGEFSAARRIAPAFLASGRDWTPAAEALPGEGRSPTSN